ncbi:MAG TPA: DUF2177 family protein [Candidatus Saccharimonadales bacterium]
MEYIGHYLLVGTIFAAVDAVWIGIVANKFYKSKMSSLLREKPNFVAAVIFYLVYIFGVVVLALEPALDKESAIQALGLGAVVGLTAYAAYDLTNASTLKGWSVAVTVVDLAWGTFITAATTLIAYLILA